MVSVIHNSNSNNHHHTDYDDNKPIVSLVFVIRTRNYTHHLSVVGIVKEIMRTIDTNSSNTKDTKNKNLLSATCVHTMCMYMYIMACIITSNASYCVYICMYLYQHAHIYIMRTYMYYI